MVRNYKDAAAPSFENVLDIQYGHNTQRIESATQTGTDPFNQLLSYDDQGSLTQIQTSNGLATETNFSFTSNRLLREVQRTSTAGSSTEVNGFDYAGRRTDGSGPVQGRIVYFHHEDRVVAIGVQELTGGVNWTHALGYGPFGLSFIKDLTGNQNDFYVFPDQVGTPFAFKNAHTGDVFYIPRNPWGDLLATPNDPVYERGYIPNTGFELPSDPLFDYPPFGINGHLTNPTTGLTVMHFRQYHPRLGQFTTPDFVSLDAFDPQTFYGHSAYGLAGGSPMVFYDPDGLNFENVGDGLIRIEFTMDGVKQEIFVDSIIAEQYVRGKIRVGSGYFGPIPGEMSGRELINTIQLRREMFAEAWIERLYPNKQVKITPHYVANIERDALIVVFATSTLPLALHSAMTLGVKGSLMVSGSSALFDTGQQYFVEGRSLEEISLMRSAGAGYLALVTGGIFKMGLSSTNAWVTGGTKTLGFIGSGIGAGYGGYTTYEGIQEGDIGKTGFGVMTTFLGVIGAYSMTRQSLSRTRSSTGESSGNHRRQNTSARNDNSDYYSMENVRRRWWASNQGRAPRRANPDMPRGREYVELSHTYIENNSRIGRFVPNWFKNRGWNLKPMWGTEHARADPQRYNFMKRPWKQTNPLPNPFVRQWLRMPVSHRVGAGIGIGSLIYWGIQSGD